MVKANHTPTSGLRTVVVPAAGLGTRFLPATKTVPKELLPVVDTPGIELVAEEAAEAGAQRLAVITAPSKDGILAHFGDFTELQEHLAEKGKTTEALKVSRAADIITVQGVVQDKPLGLGHAVGLAENALDDDEDIFAVMLPDDLVLPIGVTSQMLKVQRQFGGTVLCAMDVALEEVSKYGVFDIADVEGQPTVKQVKGMVEKPSIEEAPSTFVATGRYLFDRHIFDALRRITPGKGGELQLTDAIDLLIQEGHPVHILIHSGQRHDLGNPGGYIVACIELGMEHPVYGETVRNAIAKAAATLNTV
ncbi:UTP--glucose-1-phosphate uridylyltransferase [Corynebacterium faecale]|uniref:UTP--glucose-1-phosphate uridylyltransferase n=1 Tax=Corynebacterium faecale TaxID=1758466 RepID=UPI0025B2F0E0|nr:UTP--glucose-1-phosphate uridylyltransferase [Corynebacterium faecale]WJY91378.1 UTP--glucose-1-phosphate uridylyltransferase [Corynebacterium faecale]